MLALEHAAAARSRLKNDLDEWKRHNLDFKHACSELFRRELKYGEHQGKWVAGNADKLEEADIRSEDYYNLFAFILKRFLTKPHQDLPLPAGAVVLALQPLVEGCDDSLFLEILRRLFGRGPTQGFLNDVIFPLAKWYYPSGMSTKEKVELCFRHFEESCCIHMDRPVRIRNITITADDDVVYFDF